MAEFEDILKDKLPKKFWFAIFSTIGVMVLVLLLQGLVFIILDAAFKIPLQPPTAEVTFHDEIQFASCVIGLGFFVPFVGILAYRKYIQKLPILTLISATKFRPRLLFLGAITAIIIIAIDIGIGYFMENFLHIAAKSDETPDRVALYGVNNYLGLMALYFVAVSFQASAEELFFRSTLMQYIRRTGLNMNVAILLVSIIFCSGHMVGGVPNSALFAVFMMGLAFQIGTRICQGIEAAMGAHIVNNFVIIGFVGLLDNSGAEDPAHYISGVVYFAVFLGTILLAKRLWPEDFARDLKVPVLADAS